jgi:hypothetical protein
MAMRRRRYWVPAGLVLLVWLLWFGNHTIDTTEQTVVIENLPEAFSGLRIALLTDLHGNSFGKDGARLLSAVEAAKPDLIALCGDWVDDAAQVEAATALAAALAELAPTYYVTGNHEWACGAARELKNSLSAAGVQVLADTFTVLERDGERLILAGVDDPNGLAERVQPEELISAIHAEFGQTPIILLSHRNDALARWSALGVELVLCGHGHGGVIRLPLVGGLFGAGRTLFPDYAAGLYRMGATQMVVSRGLGNNSGTLRLFNRPELSVICLASTG